MYPSRATLVAAVAAATLAGCAQKRPPAAGPTSAPAATGTASQTASSARPGAPAAGGAAAPAANQRKSIASVTATSRKIPGLFTLYQDTVNGSLHMAVTRDQLDKEYIYFAHVENGALPAGAFRGAYGDNNVFTVRRNFNRVEMVTQEPQFEFPAEHPLARAAAANISPAVVVSQEIVAEDPATGTYLIKADDFFLSETLTQVKPTPNPTARPGQSFTLGNLSKGKTRYQQVQNYPANTDVVVQYVYENPAPLHPGGPGITDPRNVSIELRHSFIEMPQNDYQPRLDDPRVGYFTTRRTNMVSTSPTPYRDLVQRWHLVKKDPGAAVSEPVEPIVFWIENTTPVEIRDVVREAALAWNPAFEAAGFRNAIEVRQQPDDADWDAGDIRYNVLRWTSSPQPPFNGYGPSWVNPRTGQILGADVMLEFAALTSRLNQERAFSTAALPNAEYLEDAGAEPTLADPRHCAAGQHLQQAILFGLATMDAVDGEDGAGGESVNVNEYLRQGVYRLVLHEVGHTLGLNHNMKASQMLSPAELADRSITQRVGLTGSVMEYPAVNVAPRGAEGTPVDHFDTRPGPYDVWAIQFGYTPELQGLARDRLLARSTEPALAFGNDADDMRAPGLGMDPRVNAWDLSNDAIAFSSERILRVNDAIARLQRRYTRPGQSYHEMRNAYMVLTGEHAIAANTISRYVGGVYVDRAMAGQPGATQPFTPVARQDQKRAMDALARHVFAPDAFRGPADLYAHLAMQRRGYDHFGQAEDPKIHSRALNIQRNVLNHLLHPRVLTRMTDSRLYGNQYAPAEMLSDLTAAVFAADAAGNVNTFRQGLQLEYTERLASMLGAQKAAYDAPMRSLAMQQLRRIDGLMAGKRGANAESAAHAAHVRRIVAEALDTD